MAVKGYAGGGSGSGVSSIIAGTGISVSGSTGAVTVMATGGAPQTITPGITAAGTTLATATQLTAQQNIVETTPAGAGVALPLSPLTGQVVTTKNYGANTLLVYPQAGIKIGGSAAGVAASVPTFSYLILTFDGSQWW